MPSDRRSYLRRVAAPNLLGRLSLLAAVTLLAVGGACGPRPPDRERDGGEGPDRSILVAGPGDAVYLLAPRVDPPVAYLSRAEMRVYVDRSYLDWAESRLAAYVSVTTGLWRIRRPEDDPGVPIIPGDTLREFEVVDMSEWDPEMEPSEGDVRLRLGAPIPVGMDLSCTPVLSGDAPAAGMVSAGMVEAHRRDGPPGEGGREDFVEVATGTMHIAEGCAGEGDAVRILTWTVPTGDSGEGG